MAERRPYRREAEDIRRDALIGAALELIAEGGAKSATVRAIADRAGVTPGLIRHYFASKEELTRAAYRRLMDRMTGENAQVLDAPQESPLARLTAFVVASLRPPIVDPERVGLWAGFLHAVRRDPQMKLIHETGYHDYRDLLQSLIADLPRVATVAQLRADAIACNAVIDGLWLEGSVLPDSFAPGEIEAIGVSAVGAILGVVMLAPPQNPATL